MSMEKTEEISLESFLTQNNLASYLEAFIDTGYDDVKQLKDIITSEDQLEIDSFLRDVGLDKKPGHKRRFVSAMQILCYRSKARSSENKKEAASTSKVDPGKIVILVVLYGVFFLLDRKIAAAGCDDVGLFLVIFKVQRIFCLQPNFLCFSSK